MTTRYKGHKILRSIEEAQGINVTSYHIMGPDAAKAEGNRPSLRSVQDAKDHINNVILIAHENGRETSQTKWHLLNVLDPLDTAGVRISSHRTREAAETAALRFRAGVRTQNGEQSYLPTAIYSDAEVEVRGRFVYHR